MIPDVSKTEKIFSVIFDDEKTLEKKKKAFLLASLGIRLRNRLPDNSRIRNIKTRNGNFLKSLSWRKNNLLGELLSKGRTVKGKSI